MKTAAFLETFVEYPPSQPPASFSVDQIVENIKKKIDPIARELDDQVAAGQHR